MIDAEALDAALASRIRELVTSEGHNNGAGLVPVLLQSWDLEKEFVEALEFVARRFLEEVQDDIMLATHEKWPPTPKDIFGSGGASVDIVNRRILLWYSMPDGGHVLDLDPISFDEFDLK